MIHSSLGCLNELYKSICGRECIITGELGCNIGKTSKEIIHYVAERHGLFVAIDWFQGSEGTKCGIIDPAEFKKNLKGYMDYIRLIEKKSADAVKEIEDETFDLFCIDADHRYHCIKEDLELWYPKVKPGGVFCGHDYESETYDENFIEVDFVKGVHHGVTKAVNEKFGIPFHKDRMWWINKK